DYRGNRRPRNPYLWICRRALAVSPLYCGVKPRGGRHRDSSLEVDAILSRKDSRPRLFFPDTHLTAPVCLIVKVPTPLVIFTCPARLNRLTSARSSFAVNSG